MISQDTLLTQLNWRYATKKFDAEKKLDDSTWNTLEESLVLTPSSFGLQPWKFLIVTDLKIKEQLKAFSWNQSQITDCSHLVVFLAKTSMEESYVDHFVDRMCAVRSITPDKVAGYRNMMVGDVVHGARGKMAAVWSTHQLYIALGNLMTCAALIGVDTCPLEGIEPEKYDDILDLKGSGYATRVACAVGYRHSEDAYAKARKVRFEKKEMLIKRF